MWAWLENWNKLVFLLQSAWAQVTETSPSCYLILYLTSLLCQLHLLKAAARYNRTETINPKFHPLSVSFCNRSLISDPTHGITNDSHRKRDLRRRRGGMVSNHSNQKGYVRTDIDCSEDEYFHHNRSSPVAILTFEVSPCRERGCNAGWMLASWNFGQIPYNYTLCALQISYQLVYVMILIGHKPCFLFWTPICTLATSSAHCTLFLFYCNS